jgi:hypothetical protein
MTDGISPTQFHESEGVDDWRVVGDGACAYFRTRSFAAGARLVQLISELSGIEDHTPDCDLRHDGVTVVCRPVVRSEPARHPGCDLYRRGDAVLARRARV